MAYDGIDPSLEMIGHPVRGVFGEEFTVEVSKLGHRRCVRIETSEGRTLISGWLELGHARTLGQRLINASEGVG